MLGTTRDWTMLPRTRSIAVSKKQLHKHQIMEGGFILIIPKSCLDKRGHYTGYKPECIFHVRLQEWMLLNLLHSDLRYQEKQVDTTVVALLVKKAIEEGGDCFALVAGDADILPAIHVAYPDYTKNVFPVLTSPNEREGRNRQTSFKYSQYPFEIDTLILQNHVGDIMSGNVYHCTDCHKYFTTRNPIPEGKIKSGATLPRCQSCYRIFTSNNSR